MSQWCSGESGKTPEHPIRVGGQTMVRRLTLILGLVSLAPEVFSQEACPGGAQIGQDCRGGYCVPICAYDESSTRAPAPPPVVVTLNQVWEDRWGAIANDVQGPMGVAEARRTREEAIAVAHADCVARGGDASRCRVNPYVYKNGCVAFAWGNGRSSIRAMGYPREAESFVLRRCAEQAGQQCRIVYAGCSESVDVGYCPVGVKPPDSRCRPPDRRSSETRPPASR